MCIASNFVTNYSRVFDKKALKTKMQGAAIECKQGADDDIYTFRDGSKLLDRKIVGEWQLFKGVEVITKDRALTAIRAFPALAAKMALVGQSLLIYVYTMGRVNVDSREIAREFDDVNLKRARRVLMELWELGYLSREKVQNEYVYTTLFVGKVGE